MWKNIFCLRNEAVQSTSVKCNKQHAMTQQQCQLTNSKISTLELSNKQTNKQISELHLQPSA